MELSVPVFVVFMVAVTNGAKILGIFQFPSLSHQIVYRALCKQLSLRGHQVTIVTPNPVNDKTLTNLTEIDISEIYDVLPSSEAIEFTMSKDMPTPTIMAAFYDVSEKIQDAVMKNTNFKRLYNNPLTKFDLVISEALHPGMYSLAGKYKVPVIGISSLGVVVASHESVGNLIHPVLYPDMNLPYVGKMSLKEKLYSTYFTLWLLYHYNLKVIPAADKISRKYLGNNGLPYLGDIGRNVSVLFINTNPIIYESRPNIPTVVPLGLMHIEPVKPLPKDIQDILDNAKDGVVYFSLGSNVKSSHLPKHVRQTILTVLSQLPYTVLWKLEDNILPNRTSNIIYRSWFPQRDMLAHPNMKLFITQGGLQSIEESILAEVPMVGIPFIGDQPMTVKRMVLHGIAVEVDPSKITIDSFRDAIFQVINNDRYKRKIKECKAILEDQPMSSLEKAVWWTEYVIRYNGTRHLKYPTTDVPWWEYFLLDIIGALLLILLIIIAIIVTCVKALVTQCNNVKVKSN